MIETRIAKVLCDKFAHATEMKYSAEQYFVTRSRGINQVTLSAWEKEIIDAEQGRLSDRKVMDVLKARPTENSRPERQLPSHELVSGPVASLAEQWIQMGLEIEERQ